MCLPRIHLNDGRAVSTFVAQRSREGRFPMFGYGGQSRAFCYGDDLVHGMIGLMATRNVVAGPVNLGDPGEVCS